MIWPSGSARAWPRKMNSLASMEWPEHFLASLEGAQGWNKIDFLRAHEEALPPVSVRFHPTKSVSRKVPRLEIRGPVPWSSYGFYLQSRPSFTLDPLLHAGAYYVQEASSMFLEQAVRQCLDLSGRIRALDLCAAPGGKSTLLHSILSPESVLVSNEPVRNRQAVLYENLTKWGSPQVLLSRNDPSDFSSFSGFFDLIVVDAPCSGSGLFRRDPRAKAEWSPEAVIHCQRRQQRILDSVWPALRPQGVLIYCTCSFSVEENEGILDWMMHSWGKKATSISLSVELQGQAAGGNWQIIETHSSGNQGSGYRFYPDKLEGEGFFLTCLKKDEPEHPSGIRMQKASAAQLTSKERERVNPWIGDSTAWHWLKNGQDLFAIAPAAWADCQWLNGNLSIQKAGTRVGRLLPRELIPHHELALSGLLPAGLPVWELNEEEALAYLRKEDSNQPPNFRGWALVTHQGLGLGWAKGIGSRYNNYYPTDWRVRKDRPDSGHFKRR
jgi:16S rRNA C967 or C1407 C5-methylase (RsmB/RsmF family)/NOL1/NOP2/fmu family ribosome biogenesis protein